jgi:hypothetical protein
MSAMVSTDFLLRFAQATPEQQAAIDRFLGGGAFEGATGQTESEERRGKSGTENAEMLKAEKLKSEWTRGRGDEERGAESGKGNAETLKSETLKSETVKSEREAMGGMAALMRIEQKLDGLIEAGRFPQKREPLGEEECLQAFRLFGELLAMGTELTASPARVFDLMVFRKLTKAEAAVACKCAASLITKRVAAIEAHFGMPMKKLCDFASDIKERQRTVKGDRYAKKKRGAGRDEEQQDGDGGKAGLEEDDGGYLPEERQSADS